MDGRTTGDGCVGDSGGGSGDQIDITDTQRRDEGHAGNGTTATAHVSSRRRRSEFCWSHQDDNDDDEDHGSPRRYRYPTLGSDRAAFVRARADPLACNLDNDMVLLWNHLAIEPDGSGGRRAQARRFGNSQSPPSEDEESIEDAYQRLFASVVRHREDLEVTLRDAGLDRVNDLFADSDSACGALDEVDNGGHDGGDDVSVDDDDDDVFDDSGVRGSWELLSDDDDDDVTETDNCVPVLEQTFCLGDEGSHGLAGLKGNQDLERMDLGAELEREQEENWKEKQRRHQQNEEGHDFLNKRDNTITDQNMNTDETFKNRNGKFVSPGVISETKSQVSGRNSSRFDSAFYESSCSSDDDQVVSTGDADQVCGDSMWEEGDSVQTPSTQTPGLPDRDNHTRRLDSLAGEIEQVREAEVCQTQSLGNMEEQLGFSSQEEGYSHTFCHETEIHHPTDPTITPRPDQSSPSPVDSPPASMDQFRPQTTQRSSKNFLHSSPILPRSSKIYFEEIPNNQPSDNDDCQNPLSLTLPGSHEHSDWNGMSILPLVACPHHHDLPVIDAPGCFTPTLVRCHAPDCGKKATLDIARHLYKNCHNCRGTYYCSRKCRRQDWKRHKHDVCHGSRVSSACKRVITFCGLDPDVKAALSRLARRGFLSSGRGCVMLGFPDLCATEEFLQHGLSSPHKDNSYTDRGSHCVSNLELMPVFVTLSELRSSKMYGGGEILQRLMTLCETYNPEHKFLLNVGIGVRWNREQIARPQDQLSPLKTSLNGKSLFHIDSEVFSNIASSPSQIHNQSSKEPSPSFHFTTDSGYNSLHRSPSGRHHRLSNNSSRSRSASVVSEDVGYGSLGDVRDSLSQSHNPLSPTLDNSVFHSSFSQPLASPLSPPIASDNVVYYCDAEPRLRCPILQKCACLRLFNPAFDPVLSTPASSFIPTQGYRNSSQKIPVKKVSSRNRLLWPRRCAPTLILTDIPGSWYEAQEELRLKALDKKFSSSQDLDTNRHAVQRKARELCFANIQRRLRQRGVSLRRQFPKVYTELVDYVAGDSEHFPSRIIFPVESHGKGKMFTCVLMPEAEPDLRWTQTSQLLDNLDISRERVWGPLVLGSQGDTSQSLSHLDASVGEGNGKTLHSGLAHQEDVPSQTSIKDVHQNKLSSENPVVLHQVPLTQKIEPTENTNSTGLYHQDPDFLPKRGSQRSLDMTTETKELRCSRCLAKPDSVDRSTQTSVPINTRKVKQTVPDLIKFCPTSSLTRRKFNTNFPIFSFDSDILDRLTCWTKSTRHFSHDQNAMRPLLLGHLACSSLLLRYQTSPSVSSETVFQQPTHNTGPVQEYTVKDARCPFTNSGFNCTRKTPKYSEVKSESSESKEKQIAKRFPYGKDFKHLGNQGKPIPSPTKAKFDDRLSERPKTLTWPTSPRHKLPSQDQVDSILSDWKDTSCKTENHTSPVHVNTTTATPDKACWSCTALEHGNTTTTTQDKVPWSCTALEHGNTTTTTQDKVPWSCTALEHGNTTTTTQDKVPWSCTALEHGNTTTTTQDKVPWSCRFCSDRHPHNHPYRDPACVSNPSNHLCNHSNLSKPKFSSAQLNSNHSLKHYPHHHHHHLQPHQQLQHHGKRQQQQQEENLQSDW